MLLSVHLLSLQIWWIIFLSLLLLLLLLLLFCHWHFFPNKSLALFFSISLLFHILPIPEYRLHRKLHNTRQCTICTLYIQRPSQYPVKMMFVVLFGIFISKWNECEKEEEFVSVHECDELENERKKKTSSLYKEPNEKGIWCWTGRTRGDETREEKEIFEMNPLRIE